MVIFAHGWEYWKHLSALDAWSLRVAELCLTNSEFTLRKMRERLDNFRGSACPLGLSPDFRVNETPSEESRDRIVLTACDGHERPLGDRVLLLVARMDPGERQKGHDPLLEVFPSLLDRYPDLQLVFSGDGGDRARIAQAVTAKNVAGSVFMPGRAPLPLLEALYEQCYAFVMPSTQEGFGLVYLEAMNYAKPCLGCFDQGAEDVIVHGETGLLVRDPHDANELSAALRRLLGDPPASREMGRKGLVRLRQHFTAEQYQARLVEEFSKLL
jgi:glycosyltransferase involved in cell wall biosynthesis